MIHWLKKWLNPATLPARPPRKRRKIVKREYIADDLEVIELECGHSLTASRLTHFTCKICDEQEARDAE